jgi:hypothetical protein
MHAYKMLVCKPHTRTQGNIELLGTMLVASMVTGYPAMDGLLCPVDDVGT